MKPRLIIAAFLSTAWSGTAIAQSLPLNTGYDYSNFGLYTQPASGSSTISDNYWIKIASYEPPSASATVAPAWVMPASPPPNWGIPLNVTMAGVTIGSRWLGPRQLAASSAGANSQNPAYSLFRKCFCLAAGFSNPALSIRVVADDRVQVWLNTVTSTLVGPANGNQQGPALTGTANPQHFQPGRNCLYVLVEDTFGITMGFNLAGSVSANGLGPVAAAGIDGSFAPCQCGGSATSTVTGQVGSQAARLEDDSAVVSAIVALAERRRLLRAQMARR